MKSRIFYSKPSITDIEINLVNEAMKTAWGENCYQYITRFEKEFADYIGVKHAVATSSCTGALHLGLAALGIGRNHTVVMADTNWVATMAPVFYLRANAQVIDILSDTWCIDYSKINCEKRPSAIIATHLYGNLCEMDELLEIGEENDIPIIEDAAEALGSEYHGKKAGSMGLFGVFSFHGSKLITTGEGGMLVTNDDALYEKVVSLNNHGRATHPTRQFWPVELGYKYKMTDMQAALGIAQLSRIDEILSRKREIFKYYKKNLTIPGLSMNPEYEGTVNSYWMPTVVFDDGLGVTREMLLYSFTAENIDARVFFYPLYGLPFRSSSYIPVSPQGLYDITDSNSWDIPRRAINLPSYFDMTTEDQDRVIDIIMKLLRREYVF
jgi:perosamine synthetase